MSFCLASIIIPNDYDSQLLSFGLDHFGQLLHYKISKLFKKALATELPQDISNCHLDDPSKIPADVQAQKWARRKSEPY